MPLCLCLNWSLKICAFVFLAAVNHMLKNLWLALTWTKRRAYILLNLVWHCNFPLIWLSDSHWLSFALSFTLAVTDGHGGDNQLSFGQPVCFCLAVWAEWTLYAHRQTCLSKLFLRFMHLQRPEEHFLHANTYRPQNVSSSSFRILQNK